MAVPKRKHSKSRKKIRRSHDRLTIPTFSRCGKCEQAVPAHTVCPNCGYYSGRVKDVVVDLESV